MVSRFALPTVIVAIAVACGACDKSAPTSPSLPVRATRPDPLPSFTFSGRVTEPGSGLPIEGATVSTQDGALATTTDENGSYRLAGVPQGGRWFRFSKPDFEPGFRWHMLTSDATGDIRLQRRLVIQAGETVMTTAYPDDPLHSTDFLDEGSCEPCKLVRVTVPRAGELTVRLTVRADPPRLGLKVEPDGLVAQEVGCCKQAIEGTFRVTSREVVAFIYLRPSAGTQEFELSTELR